MAREEQIFEASKIYSEHVYNQTDFENAFIAGAQWSDKIPPTVNHRLSQRETAKARVYLCK